MLMLSCGYMDGWCREQRQSECTFPYRSASEASRLQKLLSTDSAIVQRTSSSANFNIQAVINARVLIPKSHSLTHSLTHCFTHFTHCFILVSLHASIHFSYLCPYLLTCLLLIHSPTCSLISSLPFCLPSLLTHSLTHSLVCTLRKKKPFHID